MSPDIIYIYRSDGSVCNELIKNMVGKIKPTTVGKIITKIKFTAAGT